MDCGAKGTDSELRVIPEWQLRFCLVCFAKNLVTKSGLNIYRLTENDIRGLQTIEFKTESGFGQIVDKIFYCARHLVSLAREKHSDFDGPRQVGTEKVTARQDREDLVATATLLHDGLYWRRSIPAAGGASNSFSEELDHHIAAKSFKKPSALKKRPIAEILNDYASFVAAHHHLLPTHQGRPFFHPAPNPGPLTPSPASIDPYNVLRKAAEAASVDLRPWRGNPSRFAKVVSSMQAYVLDPDSHDLNEIIHDLCRFEMVSGLPRTRTMDELPDWAVAEVTELVEAAASLGKLAPTKVHEGRIRILKQVGAIMWDSLSKTEAACLPTSGVDQKEHWGGIFYHKGTTSDVLKAVYTGSQQERKSSLTKIGTRAPTPKNIFSGDIFASAGLRLNPIYINNNNLTALRLSDRTKVSRSDYKKEIHRTMSLIHSAIISQSGMYAVLHKFNCFIRQIGLNSYSDEYYSDDGYDFEEEMRAYMENDPEGFYLEYLASP